MKSIRATALALALAPFLAGDAVAGAPAEARCVELGDACVMSEPLNFGGVIPNVHNSWDLPDSEGPGAKEAQRGYDRIGGVAFPTVMVPGSTTGLSSIDFVMGTQAETGDGGIWEYSREFTGCTFCFRIYISHAPGWRPPSQHYKLSAYYGDAGAATAETVFYRAEGGVPLVYSTSNFWDWEGFSTNTRVTNVSGSHDFGSECVGGRWCRIEGCFDHNADGAKRLKMRARYVDIQDGSHAIVTRQGRRSYAGPVVTGNRTWPMRQKQNGAGGTMRYWSHAMHAKKCPADDTFWIGPAREISEDVANNGAPPPPPPPPPPDDPLGQPGQPVPVIP